VRPAQPLLVQKGDRISARSGRLNGDGQTFGGELLGVQFGSFFMSNQKQGHTVFVGFEHSLRGFFAAEGGQLQNGLHNVGHVVHVVVCEARVCKAATDPRDWPAGLAAALGVDGPAVEWYLVRGVAYVACRS
jgi:hypothetical protein